MNAKRKAHATDANGSFYAWKREIIREKPQIKVPKLTETKEVK